MRPNNTALLERTSEMLVERSESMSFDASSIGLLMENFIDMYSDAELAVIRESSSNAADSHVEAGNTDPIRVYLPHAMNHLFRVVDRGVGMSTEDVFMFFGKYGHSTKRHTDEQSGYLGLGSKAGLTYTDEFNVTAVKDGVKTLAVVKRQPDGSGKVDIPKGGIIPTDEPNGVTIEVAVKHQQTFNEKARRFFGFWTPGRVLVNDEQPTPPKGVAIDDDILLAEGLSEDYVVMGDIAYGVGARLRSSIPSRYRVVARIAMGSVNFVPNRETLRYTPLTERTLADIRDRVMQGRENAVQRGVDACESRLEALQLCRVWSPWIKGGFTYKGEVVPLYFETPSGFMWDMHTTMRLRGRAQTESLLEALFVVGFTNQAVSTTARNKVQSYLDAHSLNVNRVYFVDAMPDNNWLKDVRRVDYDIIKAIRLPSAPRSPNTKRPRQVFPVFTCGKFELVDKVKGDDIVVFSSARNEYDGHAISRLLPDAVLVDLARNRWDKFLRENPKARLLKSAIKDKFDITQATMPLSMKLVMGNKWHRVSRLRDLPGDKIIDPRLKQLIAAATRPPSDEMMEVRTLSQLMNKLYGWGSGDLDYTVDLLDAIDDYPLLGYADSTIPLDHLVDYLNLFYTHKRHDPQKDA